jgi:hypothetical protein
MSMGRIIIVCLVRGRHGGRAGSRAKGGTLLQYVLLPQLPVLTHCVFPHTCIGIGILPHKAARHQQQHMHLSLEPTVYNVYLPAVQVTVSLQVVFKQ